MKLKLILVLTALVTLEFPLVISTKDSRFQNQQKIDEVAQDAKTAPKRKVFDFLALEDAPQPRNLSPANSKNKRTRLVTFHLLNINHTTRVPQLIGRRRNVTYVRPPTSYSYYRRGHSLKLNDSTGLHKKFVTNSSQISNLNRNNEANVSNVTKEVFIDEVQKQTFDNFSEPTSPFNESSFGDNSQIESKQVIEVTVVVNNATVLPQETQVEFQTTQPTERSLPVGQVSYFLKTATTSTPISVNKPTFVNPLINSTYNSTYVSVNYFPIVNNTEPELNDSLYIGDSAVEISSNLTNANPDSSSFNKTDILITAAPSTSLAPSVVNDSINLQLGKSNVLEEIPKHFKAAPISPARVASLLGIQQESRSSISDFLGNSGGFLGLGDFGNFGDLTGKSLKSSSNLGFGNYGLNFDLLGTQFGSQFGTHIGSNHGSTQGSQLGSQFGSQFESQQAGANHQNPFLGGLALDYLKQISDPKELKSPQLDLAQSLSSLDALKSPSPASDDQSAAVGRLPASSFSFPALNFNDFLGLGSLNFLQSQQVPINQLNSENLLSSLSFSPQVSSKNPTEVLPAPQSESPLSIIVDQHSETASKKADSKDN